MVAVAGVAVIVRAKAMVIAMAVAGVVMAGMVAIVTGHGEPPRARPHPYRPSLDRATMPHDATDVRDRHRSKHGDGARPSGMPPGPERPSRLT